MKFYDCKTAPSPRRVRMFIAEKGLVIPTQEVDLRNAEHLSEAFLTINPGATVPVLETTDGHHLTTTAGCRAYLESAHPSPLLLGHNDTEKGKIADLISKIESDGLGAIAECLRNTSKGMKDRALTGATNYAQIPELGARGKTRAASFFPVLNAMIGDKPFLAGDEFSAADIDAFIFCEFVKWIKIEPPESCNHLARWHERISERDSATA
ncbi:MAG: glutathione S-transferase [Burkholderiaceae bacterium]